MAQRHPQDWDQCTPAEKKLFIKQVEVFAAYAAYTDHEIGRVIQAVEDMGKLDNTLIIYINGDNGTSAEGTLNGTPNEVAYFNGFMVPVELQLLKYYQKLGIRKNVQPHGRKLGLGFRYPFSWTKQIASHLGGVRQGMCVSWPNRIKDVGGIRNQFHHVIDVAPTILEVVGIREPQQVDGIAQSPMEGFSFAYTFDEKNARAPSTHQTQYFEMMGDHALYHNGWLLSTKVKRSPWEAFGPANPDPINNVTWELYDLANDYSQSNDVAAKHPDKVQEMKERFLQEAKKYQVLPLDASVAARIAAPRPNITAGRSEFTTRAQ